MQEISEWMAWHKLEAADRQTAEDKAKDKEQGQRQATQVGAGITRPFAFAHRKAPLTGGAWVTGPAVQFGLTILVTTGSIQQLHSSQQSFVFQQYHRFLLRSLQVWHLDSLWDGLGGAVPAEARCRPPCSAGLLPCLPVSVGHLKAVQHSPPVALLRLRGDSSAGGPLCFSVDCARASLNLACAW